MNHRAILTLKLLPLALLATRGFATDYTSSTGGDAINPSTWSPSATPIISGTTITPLAGDRLIYSPTVNNKLTNPGATIAINAGAEFITNNTGANNDGRGIQPHLTLAGTGTDGIGAFKNQGNSWVQVSKVSLTADATVNLTGGGWRHDDHGTGANELNLNGQTLTVTGNQGVWLVNTTVNGPGVINANNTAEFNFEAASILPANVTMNLGPGTLHSSWDGGGRVMAGNITTNNSIIEARFNDLGKSYTGTIAIAGNTSFRTGDNGGGGGSLIINGPVTGTGQLVKDGGASVDLGTTRGIVFLNNGANDYTGGTSVISGRLVKGAAGAIPDNSAVSVSSGATLDIGGFDQSLSSGLLAGAVVGSGALEKTGAGTLTLAASAALNNDGGLNLSGGVLKSSGLGVISGPLTVSDNATLRPQVISQTGLAEYHRVGADLNTDDGIAGATFSGIRDGIPAIDSTAKPYGDNNKFVYTGEVINTTGGNISVAFGEQYDDQIRVKVDGVTQLFDTNWNTATASGNGGQPGLVSLTPGAHTIEISSFDGVGGAGPNSQWNKGVGIRVGPYTLQGPNGDQGALSQADNAAFLKIDSVNLASIGLAFGNIAIGANTDSKAFSISSGKTLMVDTSDVQIGDYTLSGNITGAGRIMKIGDGTLVLSGVTTTRNASVIDGTLRLDGTHSFASISVANGAALEGTGTSASAVANIDVGGAIAPGTDGSVGELEIGTTSINGSYAADASANGVNDFLTGDVIWGGTASFDLTLAAGYQPDVGHSFDFIDGFIDGSMPVLNLPNLGPGKMWVTDQFLSEGILFVAVPEPGSMLIGALGLGFMMRRRR